MQIDLSQLCPLEILIKRGLKQNKNKISINRNSHVSLLSLGSV